MTPRRSARPGAGTHFYLGPDLQLWMLVARFIARPCPSTSQNAGQIKRAQSQLRYKVGKVGNNMVLSTRLFTQREHLKEGRMSTTRSSSGLRARLYSTGSTTLDQHPSKHLLCRSALMLIVVCAMASPDEPCLLATRRELYHLHRHRKLGLRCHKSTITLDGYNSDSN